MRIASLSTVLVAFFLLVTCCPSSLGQPASAPSRPTPAPRPLTKLPASVLNMELRSARGQPFKLSDYSGKVLMINFWVISQVSNGYEVRALVKLQKRYWSQGVRIVSLSIGEPDKSMAAVRKLIRNYRIQYKVGWIPWEVFQTLMNNKRYAILPQTYVISRAGRIVKQVLGFDPKETKEAIEEALKEAVVFRDGHRARTLDQGDNDRHRWR